MILALFTIIVLVYLFIETQAPIEYFRLFRLKFTKYEEYFRFKEQTPSMEYLNFILMKYPSFWTKLISCPICLIVWANLLLVACNFKWKLIGFNIFWCLVGYFGLKLLINKTNG